MTIPSRSSICESLASIGVTIDDDVKVEVCLRGLPPTYKQVKTSIETQENIPSFADLAPLPVIEKKNLGEDASSSRGKIILSRFSTQMEEEIEDMAQAKDKVVVIATKIKANKFSSNQMTHKE